MYVKSSIETIVEKLNNPDAPRLKMQKLKNRKLSDFWNDIWKDIVEEAPPELDPGRLQDEERKLAAGSTEQGNATKFSEPEIEGKIRTIMDTLPHLGDGTVVVIVQDPNLDRNSFINLPIKIICLLTHYATQRKNIFRCP